MGTISRIEARQIFDSRGNPTVEVDVHLADGSFGRAAVPSGASTGKHEAIELRDGDKSAYLGKGVSQAVENVKSMLEPVVIGHDALDQRGVDEKLINADGTPNKGAAGANSILGVSMAVARAAAAHEGVPLFQHLSKGDASLLPIPMMNILNGGSHADNNVDIQEFMIFPLGASSFSEALRMGTQIFHQLKSVLKEQSLNTAVGDEGGFAPNLRSNEKAVEIVLEAVTRAGYSAGSEVFLALDVAASELYDSTRDVYCLKSEKRELTSNGMIKLYSEFVEKYPIISIEDGLSEDDWEGWEKLNSAIGDSVQIVGDDLTVTNPTRLQEAIDRSAMNTILIKLNQIGTVTETVDTIALARENGMGAIVSHRSGETEDTFIADFSVAMGVGQIKTGSASRTDRMCKYNQLLRIEEILGNKAQLPGMEVLGHQLGG
ncbi:MAG: phosphopyruvate hydratase [Candidatus Neomarinimicrobiota bacterium]|nr:phosphopyruvate hydratase [Candidatus Neomarinimicrobiota bacterium]